MLDEWEGVIVAHTSHRMAELRNASFSNAAFWLAVVELRCKSVILPCCEGNGLSVEFELTLGMSGADWAEDGRITGGGTRVRELGFSRTLSVRSVTQDSGRDSVTEMRACLLFDDARDRADEVEDA